MSIKQSRKNEVLERLKRVRTAGRNGVADSVPRGADRPLENQKLNSKILKSSVRRTAFRGLRSGFQISNFRSVGLAFQTCTNVISCTRFSYRPFVSPLTSFGRNNTPWEIKSEKKE